MKNAVLFIILIILLGLTTVEFQKRILKQSSKALPLVATAPQSTTPFPKPTIKETPVDRTLEGEYICLPKKERQSDLAGCTYGLKLQDGSSVALKIGDFEDKGHILVSGAKLRVSGKFVPITQLDPDQWKKFSITGIIRASTIQAI